MNVRCTISLVAILSCFIFTVAKSQEDKHTFVEWLVNDELILQSIRPIHPMPTMLAGFPSRQLDTTIDVVSYDVSLDWYSALLTPRSQRSERKSTGIVKAVVRSRVDNLAQVVFNAVAIAIDSVTTGSARITFTKNTQLLTMSLPTVLQRGEQMEFTIYYASLRDDNAIFLLSKQEANAENVPYAIGYTISEPEGARRWYPCKDQPHDKALFAAHVRVPKGFTVVSNGVATDTLVDGDSATVQSWRHDIPMPTYLFVVNASEFALYSQTYTRDDNSVVPISNYQFDVDVQGDTYNVINATTNVPRMFSALEARLGRYPYATYGHVAVAPFQFGGMEHQTISTINRQWLNGRAESGYAHELAHQWLGDKVSCATWADIWLNEGGATWSEALYRESYSGQQGYMAHMWSKRDSYMKFGVLEPPIYDIPLATLFNEATTYSKAAWVYHMMRQLVGSDVFFPALQSYLATYANGSVQTYQMLDFLKLAIPNPPVSWEAFFDQWLAKAGHPIFDVVMRKMDGPSFTYRVVVSQTQNSANVPDVFVTPLRLRFLGLGYVLDTTMMIDARTSSIDVNTGFEVDDLLVDNDNDVLCEKNRTLVSVHDGDQQHDWCRILGTHPILAGEPLRIHCEDVAGASVMIRTISGESVHSADILNGVSLVDTSGLLPGAYAISVTSGTRLATFIILVQAR